MPSKSRRKKRKKQNVFVRSFQAVIKHFVSIGSTNRLAIYIVLLLVAGLAGGFYLARLSIIYGYMGALACYTAAFAPIGTACSIVLSKIVHKSEVENSSADGEGIKYATAKANNFGAAEDINSPAI